MSARKNSRQTLDLLPGLSSQICDTGVRSLPQVRTIAYKGGLILRIGLRIQLWRSTVGKSQLEIATKLAERTRKFGKDESYLVRYISRVESGKHEPAAWFLLLLQEVFEITFPFEDCLVRIKLEAQR